MEQATLAGYAAIIRAYKLKSPLPPVTFGIGQRHRESKHPYLHILTPRHKPADTLEGHLTFALKYEGAHPEILTPLFRAVEQSLIESIVLAKPTGRYARRIWFLYEWLTGRQLELPALRRGSYVSALDPSLQPVGPPRNSPRHRVRNNLPATLDWFPRIDWRAP